MQMMAPNQSLIVAFYLSLLSILWRLQLLQAEGKRLNLLFFLFFRLYV